ncbi:MAG: ATP-binding protein [Chloroflexaceae bacterium]|nr:ATP-binding protein [Chloroflexaceae bacterium]
MGQRGLIPLNRSLIKQKGIGIPDTALPQLFQRFYRAEHAAATQISGFGVGLYVVREVVHLHGGSISVASEEGQGSTFTVLLPLATNDPLTRSRNV